MSNATVRAVDLGFGSVKYVLDHKANADVICGLFPSHAPFSIWQPGAGGHKQSDTIDVVVGTDTYEVGKDIARRLSANHGRVLDRNYPETKTYAALLKGALAYMAQPKIEILILGLPINNYYEKYAALLKEVATGSHVVPNIMHRTDPRAPKMVTVNVEETFVIPQPMGGLFDHFIRSRSYAEMKEQVSLVIDAGFFTFGWVTAHGGNPNLRCSGAKFGSMSDALMQIADGIEREHGLEIGVDLVDAAIRAGTSMTLFGVEQDITKHISAALPRRWRVRLGDCHAPPDRARRLERPDPRCCLLSLVCCRTLGAQYHRQRRPGTHHLTDRKFNRMRPSMARVLGLETRSAKEG